MHMIALAIVDYYRRWSPSKPLPRWKWFRRELVLHVAPPGLGCDCPEPRQ